MERLASVPGVRFSVGATARARAVQTEWYDRIVLHDGRIAVMLGHVPSGADVRASPSQRMRGAVGVAVEQGAASAIAALHRYVRHDNTLEGAGLCVVLFDAASGEIACSSAGWPGPWLVDAGGSVRQPQNAGSGPLGSGIRGNLPVESAHRVGAGEHVVLHAALSTETRARLIDLVRRYGPADPQAVCDALDADVAGTVADGHGPHALLLSFIADRADPEPLAIEVLAEPEQLPGLRERLFEWLDTVACPVELSDRLVLAMNEAVTNSIVHAYQGRRRGAVRVHADVERDRSIRISVADDGRWQPAEPGAGIGGRGVLMMQECADRVFIDRSEQGTTVTLEAQYHALPVPTGSAGQGDASRRHRMVVRTSGGTTIARLSGDVPDSASATLRRQLLTVTCGGVVPLIVDLGELGVVTEGVVHALADVARAADGAGERVIVVAPPGSRAAGQGNLAGLGSVVELVSALPHRDAE
ncbi:MAG: ATP-binding protein [Haloechinothrix sp.]